MSIRVIYYICMNTITKHFVSTHPGYKSHIDTKADINKNFLTSDLSWIMPWPRCGFVYEHFLLHEKLLSHGLGPRSKFNTLNKFLKNIVQKLYE